MDVEKFRATGGRVGGVFTLVVAGVILAVGLVELDEGFPPWVVAVVALIVVLTWASALRPALRVENAALVMTNMFETVSIPLAAIDEITVRQVLAVRAAGRTHYSSVVGRHARPVVLGGRGRLSTGDAGSRTHGATQTITHADFVEQRLRGFVDDAREVASRPGSSEQVAMEAGVQRDLAWLPIVLVGLATLAVALTTFLNRA